MANMYAKDDSDFRVMKPESIRAESTSLSMLIIKQMDRLNELLTYEFSKKEKWHEKTALLQGIYSGILVFESTMTPFLKGREQYAPKAKALKLQLNQKYRVDILQGSKTIEIGLLERKWEADRWWTVQSGIHKYLTIINEWYALLIQNLDAVNLLPLKRVDFYFEEGDLWEKDKLQEEKEKRDKESARTHKA